MDRAARYELLEKLGAGAYSTVYRARDNELGREVAIKQIDADQLGDARATDRYWAEAQVLASMQHPHIVTIYDIVRSQGWLVLELMQASLRDRLGGRPMDVRALRTTLIHALKALKYLHARGLVHSDINPGNLMVDHRKRVKLGDFGVTRGLAVVEGGIGRGAAKYMAPEALAGNVSQIGPPSDLYSLGFSCYELLCGAGFRDLFPGLDLSGTDADATWMMWHAAADRRLPPICKVLEGVPPDLAAIIDRLVQKAPAARFQTADEVLDLLGENTQSSDREPQAATSSPETPSASGPRPWVIAVCVLSMLLSLGMLFLPSGSSKKQAPPPAIYGVVRVADLERRVLELEDPSSGVPEEVALPAKPKILLMRPGEADQFILPRELQPGDWVEVQLPADPQGDASFKVARPVPQTGELRSVDPAAMRVTIAIESGRLRDEVVMQVPARTRITLNGQPAKIGDLRAGDRLKFDHLLDPTGQQGHLVSSLAAFRGEDVSGFIQSIDNATRQLVIAPRRMAREGRTLHYSANCPCFLSTGEKIPCELRVGDRVRLSVDSEIRTVWITRGDSTEVGLFAGWGEKPRTIQFTSDEGGTLTYSLADRADLRMHGETIPLEALRPQFDRLTLTLCDTIEVLPEIVALDAIRAPRHNRWAFVLGNGNFDDPTVMPVPHFLNDAQNLHTALTRFYAVDPEWSVLLVDPGIEVVRDKLQEFLPRIQAPMQLIVAVFGHAYRGADGRVYLAFRDYQWKDPPGTGLPLESLVQALERCPAQNKLLLLDLTPVTDRPDGVGLTDLPTMLATLSTPIKTLQIIGASSEGEQSDAVEGGRQGWFGRELTTAFRGAADPDRDLTISGAELMAHLNQVAFQEPPLTPVLQHPFEWGPEEEPAPRN